MREILTGLGKIQLTESNIITFPSGIIGLRDYTDFVIVQKDREVFSTLIPIDDPLTLIGLVDTSRMVINKVDFRPYVTRLFPVTPTDKIFAVITINRDELTADLINPIVVLDRVEVGIQIRLKSEIFSNREALVLV